MKKLFTLLSCIVILTNLAGCSTASYNALSPNVIGVPGTIRVGKVVSMNAVAITPTYTNATNTVASVLGGAAGAAISRKVGKGRGNELAMAVGGIIGAAGVKAAMDANTDKAVQFIIKFGNRNEAVVMAGNFDRSIRPGDTVQLVFHGYRATSILKV